MEGNTIIPLSSIGFGFGAGGGSGKTAKVDGQEGMGGGTGGAGGIKPVAVIVIDQNGVRVEPLKRGMPGTLEKVGDIVAKAMDKGARGKQDA